MLRPITGGVCAAIPMLTACATAAGTDERCVTCATLPRAPTIAKEIIDTTTGTVYIAGGAKPIGDDAWQTYLPPAGLRKNTTPHLRLPQFQPFQM